MIGDLYKNTLVCIRVDEQGNKWNRLEKSQRWYRDGNEHIGEPGHELIRSDRDKPPIRRALGEYLKLDDRKERLSEGFPAEK